jgi:ferredoxin-NADP reductase
VFIGDRDPAIEIERNHSMATATPRKAVTSPSGQEALTVQVIGRAEAAREAVTLWLAQPGTQRAPAPYRAGQFITLALPSARGTLLRSYSLCGDGDTDRPWEITIKRQPDGAVSPLLCDRVLPGMALKTSLPLGAFVLPAPLRPDVPLIFVATGSGITPIMGLLRALARHAPAERPPVQLHYAYHSPADAIYARELAALDATREWLWQWHYVSTGGHRLSSARVLAMVGSATPLAHWYICGAPSLKSVLEGLLPRQGLVRTQIHTETFSSPRFSSSATRLASAQPRPAGAAGSRVRLAESGAVLAARPGESLLETLERHGYRQPFSCRAGACGTCRLKLLAGRVRNGEGEGHAPDERTAGYVLSCVAEPVGDVVLAGVSAPTARPARRGNGPRGGGLAARQSHRTALRGTLIAASLALFLGVGRLVSQAATAQATSSSSGSASQSSSATGSGGTSTGSGGTSSGSGTSGGASASQYPSGTSSITTSPSQTTTSPHTSSGVS